MIDLKLKDIVSGLYYSTQFKPLTHSQKGSYIMLARIYDEDKKAIEKIEALNIKHSYTG